MMRHLLTILIIVVCTLQSVGQVNHQTGSATFSLPMFNWQDNNSRLNSIVALNYNSGNGLKVNDIASNAGQGWSLVAGGVITRMQVGEPDDQKPHNNNGAAEDITKYPAGYLYAENASEKGCPNALTKYPLFKDKNHLYKQHNILVEDRELDYFSFQFNGRYGLFVLNKDNTGVLIGDSKIKITFTRNESMPNIRTTITSFNVQDENGLIYKFTDHGSTKVMETNYCNSDFSRLQKQPNLKYDHTYFESTFANNQNQYIINSWYLTEIEDAFTHRIIRFNYTERNITTIQGIDLSYNASKNYSIISRKTSKITTRELSSIIYPDNHVVYFNYGAERADLNGDKVLSSVDIKYQNRYLSKYVLTTSYFIANRYGIPVTPFQKKVARLCLLSVRKIGVDLKAEEKPYRFDYYLGSSNPDDFVPPPFFSIKDIWGYYNGDLYRAHNGASISITPDLNVYQMDNNHLMGLCFIRDNTSGILLNPKTGYAKNGLLKQIIYPTGGALGYEYEQNKGILTPGSAEREVGGVHVSRTKLADGENLNSCSNPIITQYNYVLNSASQSSLWGLEMPYNSITSDNHYKPEDFYMKPSIPVWLCAHHYQYPGILSNDQAIGNSLAMKVFNDVMSVMNVAMQVLDIVKLAASVTGPTAVIIDIIVDIAQFVLSCVRNLTKDYTTTIFYNSDLNSMNPLPSQFKRVEVVAQSGGTGKTVYEFTSSDDYAIKEPQNSEMSMKQRAATWAYGLPKLTTVYDADANPVQQTENIYDYNLAWNRYQNFKSGISLYPSCKCRVKKSYSQRSVDWANADIYRDPNSYITQSNDDISVKIYDIYSGRVELKDSYVRNYKPNNNSQYLQTITHYLYDQENYNVTEITTTGSKGETYFKRIKYNNAFYSYAGNFSQLYDKNILTAPVSTTSGFYTNNGAETYYLDNSITEYTSVSNGDIKPYRTLVARTNQPQTSTSWFSYENPATSNNALNYKETQLLTYDATGNVIGMKDEGNHFVSNIYSYNDKYVVASVINAHPWVDKPAYTSFETQNTGNWTINGSPNYVTNSSVTGTTSYNLSSSSLAASLNTANPYKLSLWATNTVSVNGNASLIKTGPVVNGLTYYEYNIASGTSSVSVSGSAVIDELRIYPLASRMRTVTYDPLIGKTSECDENNRITYYEYDELGRLRFIKDENKNITRMYEYNTADKPGRCPAAYNNLAISEAFTKNDCSGGYLGGTVTYTVPANKYSSTISQADADQKAEDELNRYGQANANSNGACVQLYYNVSLSQSFGIQSCPTGYSGGTYTYSVPAGTYTSAISQADADQMAQDEIDANGQAYANLPANAVCNIDTSPDWWSTGAEQCQTDGNGNPTGHKLLQQVDKNPNSSTYNQMQWADMGPNTAECPAATEMANVTYTNTTNESHSLTFRNTATNVTYYFNIPPGVSSSTVAGQIPVGTYDASIYPVTSWNLYTYSIYTYWSSGAAGGFVVGSLYFCSTCATISVSYSN